ncbi:glycosyltransferase family 4 protein [Marixanthomonas ophiurae]|uniref:Glycosyltransferase n=1 Tax=Marixanthomonas ophiurae TaxID=387659 RepID=A0A3E1QD34_9FLAO|nr:glycosyltransferase family 4 protein [Marixanthomonas ophiurae]RFN60053.1 glycosyltransferase [Marixanthomonas ophiurae]
MRIGLVLSKTPGYSETFFTSKIKGLQAHGLEPILFVQYKETDFNLCSVQVSPKVYRNSFVQLLAMVVVFVKLISAMRTVYRFIQLEREQGTNTSSIIKRTYLNAHILSKRLDWLHFGFATMALEKENLAKAIGAKMAVSFRGFDIAIYPLKHPSCYTKLWKHVDKVHTISNDLLEKAYKLGLSKNVPVQKITPAIDANFFSSEENNAPKVNGPIKLLTVGRLHWKKGYVQMLEALAILKKNGIPFVYTIVGSGTKKEEEEIIFAAHQLNIKDEIVFAGKKNREEVKMYYKNAEIYLQYSISEGFCNAVLEAQSMKKLCIVSNAEGLAENVLHKKTGWVVPKFKPELLATQIEQIIKLSETEKTQLTDYAADRVMKEFTVEKQQKEFVKFYDL